MGRQCYELLWAGYAVRGDNKDRQDKTRQETNIWMLWYTWFFNPEAETSALRM